MKSAKPWVKRVLRPVALLLGVYAVWALAHLVIGASRPKPIWTPADLPATPPARDNAWTPVHEVALAPPADLVRRVFTLDDRQVIDLDKAPRSEIDDFVEDPATRAQLAELRALLARPRFADDCPLDLASRCKTVPWIETHRALLLDALSAYWREGAVVAGERLDLVLRADVDAAQSSRTAVSHIVTLSVLREGLTTASSLLVLERYPARTRTLRATLEGLDPSMLDARRAVISEYVLVGRPEPGGFALPWWMPYDAGGTSAEIDRRARAAYEGHPIAEPARSGSFWWLWNPKGKSMMDVIALEWGPLLAKIADARATIAARRTALLARLDEIAKSPP